MAHNDAAQKSNYVLPEQLRIGLYIYVDLPWFSHPFTFNNFKISSEEQIRTLRALKLAQFRFDPKRSDSHPEASSKASLEDLVAVSPVVRDEPVPASEIQLDQAMVEKRARIQRLAEHRQAVAVMEEAFLQAGAVMRNLEKNLLSQPKQTLEEVGSLVTQMTAAFLGNPEVALQVMGDKCGGDEAYYHSLNVSVVCLMLAKELGFTSEQRGTLAMGALLHDIGLLKISGSLLKIPPKEYTQFERELREKHVEYGVNLGKTLRLPPEILLIIAQHHELADGSGYPQGLKLDQIIAPARIVSLVNAYDNLCNPVDISRAMTPHEALSLMFSKQRGKFDAKLLKLMIHTLGVYPPGSIVKLSNEAIAMVISVNPKKSLRPWVLTYDADVPREEAILLDLDAETEVNIVNAIKPALLPSSIYTYLSPRKRITYFFDDQSAGNGGRA